VAAVTDPAPLLVELFEGRWDAARNPYTLNRALGVAPWWNPLPWVWWWHTEGSEIPCNGSEAEALALLQGLHAEYLAAKEGHTP